MNTSASPGFLTPTSTPPNQDKELDLDLQKIVVGITGLDGTLVRRRFQEKPPKQPEQDEDWCSIGVMTTTPEAGAPAFVHNSAGEGTDTLRRHEVLDVLASFYGPNAIGYASVLRDNIYLPQNREALFNLGMGVIDTDPLINASSLQNNVFVRKVDLHFRLRRRVERTFNVLNVKGASGTIHTDGGAIQGPVTTDVPFNVKE